MAGYPSIIIGAAQAALPSRCCGGTRKAKLTDIYCIVLKIRKFIAAAVAGSPLHWIASRKSATFAASPIPPIDAADMRVIWLAPATVV
ncbi:MAG TPA: hypothetical protein VHT02_04710 [Methylocella sp.]|jgi:hypothetical protein|nr:hypothetical protein [Methylocella sp.]